MSDLHTPLSPRKNSSNKEKEDLKEELPAWTNADLTDVVLYQGKMSPPCCKIRAVLNYYRVPYRIVEGKMPDSDYKKIPVLLVNDHQINDSFIMVKSLAPVLGAEKLSPELLAVENMNTYHLMVALEAEVADSVSDLCLCSCFMGGFLGCGLCLVAPCIPVLGISDGIRKKTENLFSIEQCAQRILNTMNGQTFIHGSKPGIVDVSLYGMLEPFVQTKVSVANKLLSLGLTPWHNRMAQLVPSIWD